MSKQIAPFGIRIPPEVKEKLEEHAAQNRRSLSAEILLRLEESLKPGVQVSINPVELERALSAALGKVNVGGLSVEDMRAVVKAELEKVVVPSSVQEHSADMDAIREAVKEGLKAELDRRFD